ncbi:hypothetical protein BXZ70DRAFT_134874 [Cristinia sonorae]|uniref:Protein-S-isoprenylcysteine O-methyltransferase n=1 Tax=Cristinia sonorae TaxID=1940300 RepID=A0A8K0URA8_9AGAR|nr:hypothetical protein BXZ70DRAFT_134874 [Cristinia sonorae]
MNRPLAVIPFISANTFAAYVAVRPPRPPPTVDEQAKYKARKEISDLLSLITWLTVPISLNFIVLFGVSELYMVLSATYPSFRTPTLDTILLPTPTEIPTASDYYLSPIFIIASLALYAGAFLRQLCFHTLGRHFTYQLSLQQDHQLVTHGPYSFVRHPSYLGAILAFPGMLVVQMYSPGKWWVESGMWGTSKGQVVGGAWTVLVGYVCLAVLMRVAKEDLMLKMHFGEQWVSWAKKTRYAVIPFVW